MVGVREDTSPPAGHSFRLMRWSNNQRDVEVVLSPDQTVKGHGEGTRWHFHSAVELTAYRTGRGTQLVGDYIGPYGPGDVVLLGGMLPHAHDVDGPSSGVVLHWEFPLEHPFWQLPEAREFGQLLRLAERGIRFGGGTARRLRELLGMIEESERLVRLARFFALLAELAAAPAADRTLLSSEAFVLPRPTSHVASIQEVIRDVVMRFREEITLAQMLRLSRLSKATFTRQFRRHTGRTLREFIQEVRLSAASRELAGTDVQVTEIALRSGFSEVSSFNRMFRRRFGCSPTEFRQSARRS